LPSPLYATAGLYVYDDLLTYSTATRYKTNARITTMPLQHRSIVFFGHRSGLEFSLRYIHGIFCNSLSGAFPVSTFFSSDGKKKSRGPLHGGFLSGFS